MAVGHLGDGGGRVAIKKKKTERKKGEKNELRKIKKEKKLSSANLRLFLLVPK